MWGGGGDIQVSRFHECQTVPKQTHYLQTSRTILTRKNHTTCTSSKEIITHCVTIKPNLLEPLKLEMSILGPCFMVEPLLIYG